MIVGELLDILETLPEDTLVLIDHKHLEYVTTDEAGPRPKAKRHRCEGGCDNGQVTEWVPVEVPATVMLGSRHSTLTDLEPPFQLYGRRWPLSVRALFGG